MIVINKEQIVKLKFRTKRMHPDVRFYKAPDKWWSDQSKNGYYYGGYDPFASGFIEFDELVSTPGIIVDDVNKIVYLKDTLIIYMSDGTRQSIYFDSYDELLSYVDKENLTPEKYLVINEN